MKSWKGFAAVLAGMLLLGACSTGWSDALENTATTSDPVQEFIENNPEKFDAAAADLEEFDRLTTSFFAATNAFAEASYDPDATVRDFKDAVLDIHRTGGALRASIADRATYGSSEWIDIGIAVLDMERSYDDALAAIHSRDLEAYDSAIARLNEARAEMLQLAVSVGGTG